MYITLSIICIKHDVINYIYLYSNYNIFINNYNYIFLESISYLIVHADCRLYINKFYFRKLRPFVIHFLYCVSSCFSQFQYKETKCKVRDKGDCLCFNIFVIMFTLNRWAQCIRRCQQWQIISCNVFHVPLIYRVTNYESHHVCESAEFCTFTAIKLT